MNNSTRRIMIVALLALASACGLTCGAERIRLRVSATKSDCFDVPVCARIDLREELRGAPIGQIGVTVRREGMSRQSAPGQVVAAEDGKAQLWWVLPQTDANESSTWVATLADNRLRSRIARRQGFSWRDNEGEYLDLLFAGRKVTRYVYAYDTSSARRTFETYKPFLHVFDELGKDVLTNGPDTMNPYLSNQITYPHHRGIFIGWNRLAFEGKRYDLWHMSKVHQVHQEFTELTAGPVLASSVALIHWNNEEAEPIIAERRRTTVYRQSEPTVLLLDFDTELRAVRGDVYLDGDPEHAGFQFRAHNDVAAGQSEVKAKYLFNEDGIDAHRDKDLPWVAMSYGLRGRRYSVLHMNHPQNPRPTIYSAYRDYGRFGAFFKHKIDTGQTLKLHYRIWAGKGSIPERAKLVSACSAFVDGPTAEVLDQQ